MPTRLGAWLKGIIKIELPWIPRVLSVSSTQAMAIRGVQSMRSTRSQGQDPLAKYSPEEQGRIERKTREIGG